MSRIILRSVEEKEGEREGSFYRKARSTIYVCCGADIGLTFSTYVTLCSSGDARHRAASSRERIHLRHVCACEGARLCRPLKCVSRRRDASKFIETFKRRDISVFTLSSGKSTKVQVWPLRSLSTISTVNFKLPYHFIYFPNNMQNSVCLIKINLSLAIDQLNYIHENDDYHFIIDLEKK